MRKATAKTAANSTPRTEYLRQMRDSLLPIIRAKGVMMSPSNVPGMKALALETPPWMFVHRTPFTAIPTPQGSYNTAFAGQVAPNLGYSLDVWHHGKKVVNIEWDEPGDFEVLGFKRGEWESELAAFIEQQIR